MPNRYVQLRPAGISVLLVLLFGGWCHADFIVHLKDGTSRQVSRIELRGEKADLILPNRMTITVPRSGIDYRVSGLLEPDFPNGVCRNGRVFERTEEKKESGIPQEQIRLMWEQSTEIATAIKNAGSIHKGDKVHIVASNETSYTIVSKDPATGQFRRLVMAPDAFEEIFQLDSFGPKKPGVARPAPSKPADSAPAPKAAKKVFSLPVPEVPLLQRPSLWIPATMSLGILIVGFSWTLAISATTRKKKPKRK